MKYLLVVSAPAHALDQRRFAVESAFCEHVKELAAVLIPPFDSLVVAGPVMPHHEYEASRSHLGMLDAEHHRVSFVPLYDGALSDASLARALPSVLQRLYDLVREHDVVEASPSEHIARPFGTTALALGALLGKKTIAVTGTDRRDDASMRYRVGRSSRNRYLVSRGLFDPLRHLQQQLLVRSASLVLLEGDRLYADYGRGRANVRQIHEPAFSAHHVIEPRALEQKIEALRSRSAPLELLYFGRLSADKGVERCVTAVMRARQLGRDDLRLTIMGSGEEESRLRRKVSELGLEERVVFRRPLRYGEPFFASLRAHHLLIASPLRNDAPRSVWDAIASGIPVLAFDTEFYRSLERKLGVIETVPWPSTDALGARIAYYASHREELAPKMHRCARLARENTAEQWLRHRAAWTLALFGHELTDFARRDPATFVAA